MPELPKIQPTVPVEPAQPVGIQRVNLTRPNPALTEVHEQSSDINEMLFKMGDALNRQKINDAIQNAQSDRLNLDANSIKVANTDPKYSDPDAKFAFLQDQFTRNASAIVKAHPEIPTIDGAMNDATSRQLYQLTISTVAEKHELAVKQIPYTLSNNLTAFSNAQTPTEKNDIIARTSQYLKDSVNNGTLHQVEADDAFLKFHYATVQSEVEGLVNRNPNTALEELNKGNLGLNQEDANKYKREAQTAVQYAMEAPSRAQKALQEQNLGDIISGKYKGNYWEDFQKGAISEQAFRIGTGHAPSNPGLRDSLIAQAGNFTDPVALAQWKLHNYIPAMDNLSPEDRGEVNSAVDQNIKILGSTEGQALQKNIADLKLYNLSVNKDYFDPLMGRFNGTKGKEAILIQNNAIAAMRADKTVAGRAEIMNKAMQAEKKLKEEDDTVITKPIFVKPADTPWLGNIKKD